MARAKRTRDYRAEEARRNAEARRLGFTSRAQMRRALRQGWTPQRKAGPRSKIVAPPPGEMIRPIARGLTGTRRKREESRQWSDLHSRQRSSRYYPQFTDATVDAYYAAFIDPDTRANKIENGLYALREFLVDTRGFYTDAEFDDRYGVTLTNEMVARYATPELSRRLGNNLA